jgi:hypothetical protein
MAVNKRGRHYKLTPRRKVAILKAQKISARKRKGKIARIAGGIGVVAVTGAAAGFAYKRMGRSSVKNNSTAGKELDIIRIAPRISRNEYGSISRVFFENVGKPQKPVKLERKPRKRKRLNYVESEKKRLKKEKQKEIKNYRERRRYWKSKPVPKVRRRRR